MKKEQHSDLETTPKTAKSCQPLHYFVDESGDGVLFDRRGRPLVLAEGWPQYFMVGLLDVADPEALQQDMDDLRRRLLTDPYFSGVPSMKPEAGKTALAFHAKDDVSEVRREVYSLLLRHDLRFTAVVKRMRVVLNYFTSRNQSDPTYRYHPDELYDLTVRRLFQQRLHAHDAYDIWFARRNKSDRTRILADTLISVRDRFCEKNKLPAQSRIDVRSAYLADNSGLQAVDYFLWALQRAYERGEDRFVRLVWEKIALVQDVDDTREKPYGRYYTEKRPLTVEALK
jgi:hypothetical protein